MSKETEKKLFLLDAFALIFRAHFAFSNNPRISTKGLNTSVMFGFTNTLLEVLNKQKPSHIAVVFDTSAPTFRHEEFKEYKANRQETPEDIKIGTPIVKDIVRAFNIPVIEKDGYEADDLIGTIAKKAVKEGFEIYMMTPDKDFGQLVEDNIYLYKPAYMGNAVDIMGPKEVMAKWDIADVDKVRDILGLQGDSSDNIPGIPGIGPKTASKLLKLYGTVENIIDHVDELKGKQKQVITEFGEQGILSKRLATIVIDAPIEIDYKKLEYTGPDKKKLQDIFNELEFRTLSRRVFNTETSTPSGDSQLSMFSSSTTEMSAPEEPEVEEKSSWSHGKFTPFVLEKEEEIKILAANLEKSGSFVIESVTDDPNPVNARVLGFSFCFEPGRSYFVDCTRKDEGEIDDLLKHLKPVFENGKNIIIGHNIKYEIVLLKRWGIEVSAGLFDTMLAHYLLDADVPHTLESVCESYMNYSVLADYTKYIDKGKRSEKISKLDFEALMEFGTESAFIIYNLYSLFTKELADNKLESLYYDMEIPLVPVLATMEFNGVSIDKNELQALSKEVGGLCAGLEKDIYSEADTEFNINSPKQLGEVLFEQMQLVDKPKKTKTGQYATGEEVLSKLTDHAIVKHILDYRELQKLKSTYIDALPLMASNFDGKIHTNYSQAVAATGRLSSVNPNLQNIPIRTERGKLIRKAFIPSERGYKLFSADYSQIELRIMASFSEDPHMMEAFKNGEDIHAATASRIFSVPLDKVEDHMRRKAKSVNFGLIYGQSAFGLAQNLNISRTEAKEIIDAYFSEFAAVKTYMDDIIQKAREDEYVETLLGRRRYLRDINSRNQTMRGFAERNAINAPIQGSAADIIKIAMIKVDEFMKNEKVKSKMIMQVHDELVFEVHEDELDLIMENVPEIMSKAVKLKVPMVVDSGMGDDWLEAH